MSTEQGSQSARILTFMTVAGIILAAGKGTRMKSELPKGLHRVCGIPMAALVGRALKAAGISRVVVVVGHGGDLMVENLGSSYEFAWQTEQKGTGHAALMTADNFNGSMPDAVIVAPGDTPLLGPDVFQRLVTTHSESGAQCTLASAVLEDASGYGRVVRDDQGPCRIVEDKDATPEEKRIREVNAAIYCFDAPVLFEILPTLSANNAQGEYYLPDVIAMIRERGGLVEAVVFEDRDILRGVNDRWQMAEASKALRVKILRRHALAGVTIVDPDTTYIEPDVEIGIDTMIEPGTILEGNTRIGPGCHLGPNTKIQDSSIGAHCTVLMSHLNEATMLDGARCGPYANLRPGAVLGERAKVGNFVEIKNATLGAKVAVSHLSYIGDGSVGADSNIGAGTIFCNYDGFVKQRIEIGDNVFVGSNTTLVAPLRIGDGSMVAAGSVIVRDVEADALAFGRARQEEKAGWVPDWRQRRQRLKETGGS